MSDTSLGQEEVFDPTEMLNFMNKANEHYQNLIQTLIGNNAKGVSDSQSSIMTGMSESFQQLGEQLVANPFVLFNEQLSLMQNQMQLWQNTTRELQIGRASCRERV